MSSWNQVMRGASWVACLAITAAAQPAPQQDAAALYEQGRKAAAGHAYDEAERSFGEALKLWRQMGPAYEAHAATALLNLGESRCNSGNWQLGVAALEEALQLHRRALGPRHIRTVYNLSWLGHAYLLIGSLDRAEAVLEEALQVERELYSHDVLIGHTLLGLSGVRRSQQRLDEALDLGQQGLQQALDAGPESSIGVALAYENVATLHLQAGRPERALPLFRKARFIYEKTAGPSSIPLASVLSQEGLALMADGKLNAAETEMLQAVDLLARTGTGGEYRLAIAETNLGRLRLQQRKFADADRLLIDALALENGLPSRPAHDIQVTLQAMAQLQKARPR
jgi:tetratricopeptide (TPR) repeat protein